ncbi:hypothetical protein [Pelotalea chapellei]|uniref:hypothetical protein n=1 Tax=Pelotalea chapellei TaxID=44671 RepID=UPI001FEA1ABB|nr:hypothetical protein [Pelotalea chapellei]
MKACQSCLSVDCPDNPITAVFKEEGKTFQDCFIVIDYEYGCTKDIAPRGMELYVITADH